TAAIWRCEPRADYEEPSSLQAPVDADPRGMLVKTGKGAFGRAREVLFLCQVEEHVLRLDAELRADGPFDAVAQREPKVQVSFRVGQAVGAGQGLLHRVPILQPTPVQGPGDAGGAVKERVIVQDIAVARPDAAADVVLSFNSRRGQPLDLAAGYASKPNVLLDAEEPVARDLIVVASLQSGEA